MNQQMNQQVGQQNQQWGYNNQMQTQQPQAQTAQPNQQFYNQNVSGVSGIPAVAPQSKLIIFFIMALNKFLSLNF
jgi:hypothetical protein